MNKEIRFKLCLKNDCNPFKGRIYQCLFKNKFDRAMTKDCQDAITLREKLIFESDYDAGYLLHKSCKKSFRQFGCDKELVLIFMTFSKIIFITVDL